MKPNQEKFDFIDLVKRCCPTCDQELPEMDHPKVQQAQDVRRIIMGWKYLNNIEPDDRQWNKVFFPRYMKSAKALLNLFRTPEDALDCMEYVFRDMRSKKLDCTLETILKRSDTFREVMQRRGHGLLHN